MAIFTCKISYQKIQQICLFLKINEIKNLKNKNLLHFFKLDELAISIFKNNTLMLQGSQKKIEQFRKKWFLFENKDKEVVTCNKTIIGCDEVGVGDYFGPIVTCACYIEKKNIELIKLLNIDDSKKMNDSTIISIFDKIKNLINYKATICDNKTYNILSKQYKNNKIILTYFHNKTLNDLTNKLNINEYSIVMDEYATKKNYEKYLSIINPKKITKINIFQTKAESKFLAVACASVIARAIFLHEITKMRKKIKINFPLGSGKTIEIVKVGQYLFKQNILQNYAKLNFQAITQKIINKKF